jgi:hypothetical protein
MDNNVLFYRFHIREGYTMQKTAQKRSVLNRLREMSNVSGIAAEKFFNPQFQEVMENLRAIDASIRAIVTGQEIEGADPDPGNTGDSHSLKDLLKSSKSSFNRREYMTAVADLGRFHKKFFDIVQQVGKLHNKVNEVHHQFLFQDLDEDRKKQLHDLKSRFATEQRMALVKEASIMDFFYNIGTKRGRALAFYEKRYPKEVNRLKKETNNLLSKSESMLATLLSSLKEMASARATRNVDKYMTAAAKITKGYENYDKLFKDYYTVNVKGFLEKIELIAPTKTVSEEGLGKTEIPTKEAPELDLPPPSTGVVTPGSGGVPPSDPTRPSSEFGHISVPGSPSIDLKNPQFPSDPRLPSNMGPQVPAIPTPADTEPQLTPPSMESSQPPSGPAAVSPPAVGRTMLGVAPQANPPRPGTIPYTSAHNNFMESLISLSKEDPIILSSYIKKYAQSIQGQDPEVAIKLFQIAKSIRG